MALRLYRAEGNSLCQWEDDAKKTDSPEGPGAGLCASSQEVCPGSASVASTLFQDCF